MGKAVFVGLRRLGEGGGHLDLDLDSRRVGKRGQLDKKGSVHVSVLVSLGASAIRTMTLYQALAGHR